eukprot:GHVT01060466.1.p1 GENE.GHVT01060466.1~~GHVT01060466.1.p1  ORF type:complete len:120 (-),score=11.86 GHVT01060466.1:508-867(-)
MCRGNKSTSKPRYFLSDFKELLQSKGLKPDRPYCPALVTPPSPSQALQTSQTNILWGGKSQRCGCGVNFQCISGSIKIIQAAQLPFGNVNNVRKQPDVHVHVAFEKQGRGLKLTAVDCK